MPSKLWLFLVCCKLRANCKAGRGGGRASRDVLQCLATAGSQHQLILVSTLKLPMLSGLSSIGRALSHRPAIQFLAAA